VRVKDREKGKGLEVGGKWGGLRVEKGEGLEVGKRGMAKIGNKGKK
jgi:hypothetical protein